MGLLNLRRFKPKAVAPEASKKPAASPVPTAPRKLAVSSAPAESQKGGTKEGSFLHPRVSEKATVLKGANAYVFNVPPAANKVSIAAWVAREYKKTPVAVRILPIPRKKIFARGKIGVRKGGKKAYVFLKKGETIET